MLTSLELLEPPGVVEDFGELFVPKIAQILPDDVLIMTYELLNQLDGAQLDARVGLRTSVVNRRYGQPTNRLGLGYRLQGLSGLIIDALLHTSLKA